MHVWITINDRERKAEEVDEGTQGLGLQEEDEL